MVSMGSSPSFERLGSVEWARTAISNFQRRCGLGRPVPARAATSDRLCSSAVGSSSHFDRPCDSEAAPARLSGRQAANIVRCGVYEPRSAVPERPIRARTATSGRLNSSRANSSSRFERPCGSEGRPSEAERARSRKHRQVRCFRAKAESSVASEGRADPEARGKL